VGELIMNFRRALSAAVFLTSAVVSPACGEDDIEFAAAIGMQGYGRCHMDECGFFVIDAAAPIATGKDGVLFVISLREWSAEYRMRGDNDQHEYDRPPISVTTPTSRASIVYCSKKRPILFDYFDGSWNGAPLRPGDQGAIYGANESALQFYFAACHRFITRDVYASATLNLAKRLGYHFDDADKWAKGEAGADQIKPLDVLK
jgi:hypothetical protein